MGKEFKVEATFSLKKYADFTDKEKVELIHQAMLHMDKSFSLGISVMVIESEE